MDTVVLESGWWNGNEMELEVGMEMEMENKNEMNWLTKMEKLIKNQNGKIGKIMETFNGIEG